jgi:DinB superfamily
MTHSSSAVKNFRVALISQLRRGSVKRSDCNGATGKPQIGFADTLAKLEKQKTDLLFRLENWPPDKLNRRPGPAEWSVLEVLDHIVKTEVQILSAARTGLERPHRIGIADKLRTLFLQAIFSSDRKVKVPVNSRGVLPGSDLHLSRIVARWNDSRAELHSFVARGNSELLGRGIFKHPVGGWMGMEEILEFFAVHIVHHQYQLRRIFISISGDV